jgi:hypothetical protein
VLLKRSLLIHLCSCSHVSNKGIKQYPDQYGNILGQKSNSPLFKTRGILAFFSFLFNEILEGK